MRPDLKALGRDLDAASSRLFLLDYDGTLAPFDPDPVSVTMLPESERALRSLSGVPDTTVAVVSGRPLDDIERRVPPGVLPVGSHGRESPVWDDAGAPFPAGDVRLWAESVLGHETGALQVKPHGLALNLRALAPEDQAKAAPLLAADCPVPGVKTLRGRRIVEWMAEDAFHKGDAALRLKEETMAPDEGIVVIGDDTTDEDMFRALPGAATIHVGDGDSAAAYRLDDVQDVASLLAAVSEALCAPPAGRRN